MGHPLAEFAVAAVMDCDSPIEIERVEVLFVPNTMVLVSFFNVADGELRVREYLTATYAVGGEMIAELACDFGPEVDEHGIPYTA